MRSSARRSSSKYTAKASNWMRRAISFGICATSSSKSRTEATCRPRSMSVVSISCSRCAVVSGGIRAGVLIILASSMEGLKLPLDHAAIERILPHRYPFLLVDRITEIEVDKRIVGIKNVTLNERYLAHRDGELPTLPPTILTEAIAQVGAILILAKPENRQRLPFFAGIDRVRYRRPVHPGDVVEIEAVVRRLRSRMGQLRGVARVDGKVVVDGTMTFALGQRSDPGGMDEFR